jgi:hypothetical protein
MNRHERDGDNRWCSPRELTNAYKSQFSNDQTTPLLGSGERKRLVAACTAISFSQIPSRFRRVRRTMVHGEHHTTMMMYINPLFR